MWRQGVHPPSARPPRGLRAARARFARLLMIVAILGGLFGAVWPALGQGSGLPSLPGLPKPASAAKATDATSAASAPAAVNESKERERLLSEIAEIRAWNNQLTDGADEGLVSAGITREEIEQAARKLTQWAIANEGKLRALDGMEAARAELAAVQAAQGGLTGPGGKPPFSILMVDDWARDADARRTKIAALEASTRMAERELVRLGEATKKTGSDVRRLEEAARTASPPIRRLQTGGSRPRNGPGTLKAPPWPPWSRTNNGPATRSRSNRPSWRFRPANSPPWRAR